MPRPPRPLPARPCRGSPEALAAVCTLEPDQSCAPPRMWLPAGAPTCRAGRGAWPAPARTGLGEWGVWAPGTVPFAAGRGRSFSFAQRGDPSVVADSLTGRVSDVHPASSPQRQSVACPVGPGPGLQFQARPFWKGLEFALHQSEPQWGGTWASRPGSPVGRVRCRAGHLTSFVPVVLLPAAESESPPWGWGRAGPGSLCVGQWAACVYRV